MVNKPVVRIEGIAPTTATDFQGVINADVNVLTAQPIALTGVINATVRTPDLPEGFVDVGELEVLPDTPAPTPLEALGGIINASLNKTFDEPVQIAGVVNARANIAAAGGEVGIRGSDEDPENKMLDVGDLTGEIDLLSISDEVKARLEPVLLDGEINATLVRLFSEPIIIDGVINARINYGTGANIDQGAGGGGGEGQTAPGGGQQAPNIGDFNPQTPGEQPQQGFNLNPQGGLVANRNGGGGNAIQVTFPASLRNAITDQAGTLKEIQASQKEFYQSSIAYFDKTAADSLTANQHLSGIRRALLSEDAPLIPLATETTLSSLSGTLAQIAMNTERIADAPLVQGLVDAGVAFPNDPQDPTNAAFTESPIQDILGRGGLSLFADLDAIKQNLEMLQGGATTPDLAQIGSAESPGFFNILNLPETKKVEVVNPQAKVEITNEVLNVQGSVKAEVQNTVGVRQVGTFAVTQAGQFVVQLASGDVIPVEIVGGLEGLAIDLADSEVSLRAVGAI